MNLTDLLIPTYRSVLLDKAEAQLGAEEAGTLLSARLAEEILRTGPDLCQGKPAALDRAFDHTTVRCSVTRSLSPGNYSELSVHFFTNNTLNPRMETWWTYEPGL